jgi:hypothetical protein
MQWISIFKELYNTVKRVRYIYKDYNRLQLPPIIHAVLRNGCKSMLIFNAYAVQFQKGGATIGENALWPALHGRC